MKIENLEINELSRAELEKTVDILKDRILSLSPDAEDPERNGLVQKLVLARLKILESDDTTVKAGKISMGLKKSTVSATLRSDFELWP